ncbi:aspartyl protease family protein [Marinoscillum furvescens]|uniref:PDZ domain-containing protein n=1 Tax=Marinoscillum furvescens DSM 4134 TaxID=1122208 RepID=A0A3D9L263_MARFU|nr:aspartyl protease family protein [Marinoscillum furvescens]RED97476.1 PDZ domain-containing protein [Marinoscillum furvescens DSM 4134]
MKKLIVVFVYLMCSQVMGQTLVTSTPFELFGDHIFIQLSVDDSRPVDFIFDTGDGLTVLDTDVAAELKLEPDHKASKTSAQGRLSGALIPHNKIEVGAVKIEDIELYTTELTHLEQSVGRNIDGIIGYDLLKNYVVKIDYEDMMLKVYKQEKFDYTGYGEPFNFKLVNYMPCMTAIVTLNNGEVYEEEFFVNTGAGTTMDFNTPFANKRDVIAKTGEHYSYPVAGIGKVETMHYEGRVQKFSFGTFDFEQLPVGISQAKHGIQHHKKAAGIVGNKLLSRFNITFDFKNKTMYLEANKYHEEPFKVNASGLNLQYDKSMEKLLVHRVYENSPAKLAGIKQDDELLAVNGKPVSAYTLPEIRELLKDANSSVEVKVSQYGIEKVFTLDLDALL